MSEYSAIFIILIVSLLIVLIWTQFCLMQTNQKILNQLKNLEGNMEKQYIALDNMEYSITGTSQNQKSAQDYVRQNFSADGKLRSDNTSLRDYLENQRYRHRDIKLIGVELRWLRQMWEYRNVSSKTKIEDKIFRQKALNYEYERLRAMGIEGETLVKEMEGYRKRDEKLDKKTAA